MQRRLTYFDGRWYIVMQPPRGRLHAESFHSFLVISSYATYIEARRALEYGDV